MKKSIGIALAECVGDGCALKHRCGRVCCVTAVAIVLKANERTAFTEKELRNITGCNKCNNITYKPLTNPPYMGYSKCLIRTKKCTRVFSKVGSNNSDSFGYYKILEKCGEIALYGLSYKALVSLMKIQPNLPINSKVAIKLSYIIKSVAEEFEKKSSEIKLQEIRETNLKPSIKDDIFRQRDEAIRNFRTNKSLMKRDLERFGQEYKTEKPKLLKKIPNGREN